MSHVIKEALTLWNIIAEVIIEREEIVYAWAVLEKAISHVNPFTFSA